MREALHALEPLKSDPSVSGIFSDLDGTLSEIAPTPNQAVVTEEMRELLLRIAARYAVLAIVSGRDSDDARRIVGIDELIYIGNHGLEWIEEDEQKFVPDADRFLVLASEAAGQVAAQIEDPRIIVEKKKLGFTVHFRLVADKTAAAATIMKVVKPVVGKYPFRVTMGRNAIELRPDIPVNKGDAVAAIALRHRVKNLMYAGDDLTDIDVFERFRSLRGEKRLTAVSIAVASDEADPQVKDEADFAVSSVNDVYNLLSWLAT